jgi:hypothetical protein
MTLSEELAIVSQILALRRAGKIPPIWADEGRYRIGWDYEMAGHYTAAGLRLVVENGGVEPPGVSVRPRPIQRAAPAKKPMRTAWLIPHARRGHDDAELVARVRKGNVVGLDAWQLRRGEYVARRGGA